MTQDIVAGAGLLIGVIGTLLTIHYARKSVRLDRLRKSLDWSDLQVAASELGKDILKTGMPSIVVTPSLAGATFANLLVDQLHNQPPVFVGHRVWRDDPHGDLNTEDNFLFETSKWIVAIPKACTEYTEGTILYVDDFVMSGDFLEQFRERLGREGIAVDRIVSVSVAVTKVAIKNRKAPDFYWWVSDDDEFYFPWGKAR